MDYWKSKIVRNQERDQEVWRQLEAKGWSVIIVWECELKNAVLGKTLHHIEEEIRINGEQYQKTREERRASRLTYQQERKAHKEKIQSFLRQGTTRSFDLSK